MNYSRGPEAAGTARQQFGRLVTATTLLLIRHAHTAATDVSLSGRALNVPLSPLGKEQLRDLCTVLYDVRIDAIYSSPLERARATAKAIAERQSLAVHVRDDLSEVDFGEWTCKTFAELEGTPEWRRYNRYRSTAQIPGGEHPATLAARATRALDDIQRVHPGHTVAVVSHAEVIRSAVLRCLRRSLDLYHEIEIPPASMTEIAFTANGAQVMSVGRLSDTTAPLVWGLQGK